MDMPKALSTNRLTNSVYYAEILTEYNNRFARDGKVNDAKFYREIVKDRIPRYTLSAWQKFLKRFKTEAGLVAARAGVLVQASGEVVSDQEQSLIANLKDSATATRLGIQKALNIGAEALDQLINHPELMSSKDRADLLFKAMKSQDSRIMATAKVRQDRREEVAFQNVFGDSAYQEENE